MPGLLSLLRSPATRRTCLTALATLAGCASFTPQPGPGAEPPANYVTLTRPVTALGDTQEHESTGMPLHDNDSAIDAYIEVTQRPPEQPLFGRRIMEWALQAHPDEPWLHLGDVLDLSCRSEAERMSGIFRSTGRPGAILPGNHDGLMFGIYRYDVLSVLRDRGAKKWNDACRRGAGPDDAQHRTGIQAFSKRDFISLVLAGYAAMPQAMPGLKAPPSSGRHRVSWTHPDPDFFVSAIEANLVEGTGYADSFLAQRLKLPRAPGATRDVIVIGLDTNQAGPLVSTMDTIRGYSPGSMGHVHPDQISAISHWVAQAARRGDIVVFAGHHNWRSLGLPTRILLRDVMENLDHPLVYLSAHTHRGFWAVHRALASKPLLELNVSSLSDWPIAWRRISFAYDEQAQRLLVRADLMPSGPQPSASDADLLAAWQTQTCEASGFAPAYLRSLDMAVVQRQRDSRGDLIEWIWEELDPDCETCELTRYRHAQEYQDEMLATLLQVRLHLGADAPELPGMKLPSWCDGKTYFGCVSGLLAVTRSPYGVVRELPGTRAMMNDLLKEVYEVSCGEKIRLDKNIVEETMRLIDSYPYESTSSLTRDVMEGRPSEIEYQNGTVVRLGRQYGVDVPVNRFIYGSILPMESAARAKANT